MQIIMTIIGDANLVKIGMFTIFPHEKFLFSCVSLQEINPLKYILFEVIHVSFLRIVN